jgi:hypothetical protein
MSTAITLLGIIAAGIVYLMVDEWIARDNYEIRKFKLGQLDPVPKFFHVDANFIDLAHDILHLGAYNPDSFGIFIQAVDNILQMRFDIERRVLAPCDLNFSVAKDNYDTAIVALESINLSIPSKEKLYKLHLRNAVKLAHLYILRNLDSMRESCYMDARKVGLSPSMPYIPSGLDPI